MIAERSSQQSFLGASALLFAGSAGMTIAWCGSMSAMPKMPMPGDWAMSMTWMRMPGQTWIRTGASFVVMWVVMMTAMMLPSLVPTLARYRRAVYGTNETRLGWLTTLAGAGYLFVWALLGFAIFPLGVAVATVEMKLPAIARTVPVVVAIVILMAGVLQFTPWKAHHLACCREAPGRNCILAANSGAAWRQGLSFGLHCGLSCANLTAVLLVIGVMDLRAMGAVTAAISAERLAPSGERVARILGGVLIGVGLFSLLKAIKF